MAITRLDASWEAHSPTTTTYTVSPGTDRCLVVFFGWELDGQSAITGATYGGEDMVLAFQIDTPDSGFSTGVACYYILDAGIQAAVGNTIIGTHSGSPSEGAIECASYEGFNQTGGGATLPETHTAETNENTPNPFTTIDITEASGNLVVAGVSCGSGTTTLWHADMTEQQDESVSGTYTLSFADRLSSTDANVTIEATLASQNRAAAGSAEFAAAAGGVPSASPSEGTPSSTPSEGTPSSTPSEGTPSEGTPSEGTPSSTPSEGTPSEGTPSEGTPSATPSEGTPSVTPSEGTPSEGTPSESTPSSTPSEGTPSEGTPSSSPSASPSPGWEGYTRGEYGALPGNDTDLSANYSDQDYIDVDTNDGVRVGQTAGDGNFTIHQFKDYVGSASSCTLTADLQSDYAPSGSTISLQIYNYNSTTWETKDSDDAEDADTDFELTANIADLTNYKTDGVMTCRIYQENV